MLGHAIVDGEQGGRIMDWGAVLAIAGVNIAIFNWLRSDMKIFEIRLETKIDAHIQEIRKDMKDFHGRLCAIEERNKK
jgi:hypothetical protein